MGDGAQPFVPTTQHLTPNTRALAAAAATGVLVGAALVATRSVVDQAGPASIALLRYAIGFGCLLPPALATSGWPRFAGRDLLPIALLGIGQFGILVAPLNNSLSFIPPARARLILALHPLPPRPAAAARGPD